MTFDAHELVQASTVVISGDGPKGTGTGFYLGPRLVVTANHVVFDKYKRQRRFTVHTLTGEEITCRRAAGHAEWKPREQLDPWPDLALLTVEQRSAAVSWTCELPEAREDELTLAGCPADPSGQIFEFITARLSGYSGVARELMLFQEAQIRPGFSGGLVISNRLGSVCGVIIATRNKTSDLGGVAVGLTHLWDREEDLLAQIEPDDEVRERWRLAFAARRGTEAAPMWRATADPLATVRVPAGSHRARGPEHVRLDATWGIDRHSFVGILVDPVPGDLVAELTGQEHNLRLAAGELSLPRRTWRSIPLDDLPEALAEPLDRGALNGVVVGIDVDASTDQRMSRAAWSSRVQALDARTALRDTAVVFHLRGPVPHDLHRAADRLADALGDRLLGAVVPVLVRPAALTDDQMATASADEGGLADLARLLADERARRGQRLPTALADLTAPSRASAGPSLPERLVAELNSLHDVEVDAALIREVRGLRPQLLAGLLRAMVRDREVRARTLALVAVADRDADIDTWLDEVYDAGDGPDLLGDPDDLPMMGSQPVIDAVVLGQLRRGATPAPSWLAAASHDLTELNRRFPAHEQPRDDIREWRSRCPDVAAVRLLARAGRDLTGLLDLLEDAPTDPRGWAGFGALGGSALRSDRETTGLATVLALPTNYRAVLGLHEPNMHVEPVQLDLITDLRRVLHAGPAPTLGGP
ncbi:MAG: serine protease [Actinomycetota bacterium]|nr:serine protease [Actinomycetota bacterium]